MTRMPRHALAAALLAAAVLPAAAFAQEHTPGSNSAPAADAMFVTEASASGLAEVALGQLGASKGNSEATKSFGQQMVTDHTKANDELKTIAGQKNLPLATAPKPADTKAAAAIGEKSGDAFDQAFAKKMVADHKKAVALFSKESTSGKDPELKAFAAKTLPTLKEHLQMAEKLPGKGANAMAGH
ncbi:DUF4142 domain-containing protein [Luteibacter sp. 3190]|uniref:DUF4142 domain-containing protein n=1 Tax=Luteibacter sp. 3190 TaxID=2817736 RepID=UPI00285A5EB7|nr:DUF4142 domain-containing protein [Luteibacter sp. 3190]MDR6936501.1 putative membrane protein [Luteibacter sp. 3190]